MDSQCRRPSPLSMVKPRPEPPGDLGREVPQGFPGYEVDPDTGVLAPRRVRDHHDRVTIVEPLQEPLASSEHGAMESRAKGRGQIQIRRIVMIGQR